MTATEIVGIVLALVGLAFAFETPRRWFLRLVGLRRAAQVSESLRVVAATAQSTDLQTSNPPSSPSASGSIAGQASQATVKEIVDAINAAPPFQQKELSQHYAGIVVQWEGYLRRAEEDPCDKEKVQVQLILDKERMVSYSFWFSIKRDQLPEIKTLQVDSRLRVKGTIISASGPGICVTLEPQVVEVLERVHN